MLILFLVRHGLSEGNERRIIQGWSPAALAPEGVAQAERLAKRIRAEEFDAVYSSDLERAAKTAKILFPDRPPTLTPLLREQFMGAWEGKPHEEMEREYPEIFRKVFLEHRVEGIPGAEDTAALRKRAGEALTFLAERHPEGRILAVTHGGLIHAMAGHLSGGHANFGIPGNCSVSILTATGGTWRIHTWNDTGHLGQNLFTYKVE